MHCLLLPAMAIRLHQGRRLRLRGAMAGVVLLLIVNAIIVGLNRCGGWRLLLRSHLIVVLLLVLHLVLVGLLAGYDDRVGRRNGGHRLVVGTVIVPLLLTAINPALHVKVVHWWRVATHLGLDDRVGRLL